MQSIIYLIAFGNHCSVAVVADMCNYSYNHYSVAVVEDFCRYSYSHYKVSFPKMEI